MESLEATFDGTPKKLPFFVVCHQKFIVNWGHLFPDEECQVDYIASRLKDEAVDWYVGLHNTDGPELRLVDAFIWALCAQYKDPNVGEHAHAFLRTFKQGKL